MPRLENLQSGQVLRPLGGSTVDPAQGSGEDKQLPIPYTSEQAQAQKKPKLKHFNETEMYVDSTSWINVYISKWVKAYFNVQDTPEGTPGLKENKFHVKKLKAMPPTGSKAAPRKAKANTDKAPRGVRGMRLIHIPVKDDETPFKGGDLVNHPQSKGSKLGPKYLTMRIPTIANLDAIACFIKNQFKENTPKRFYTDRGTCVTIPATIGKGDLGTHPGLVKGVQTGTR